MIGHLEGNVIFSDGLELIIKTNSGIGYQVHCAHIFAEGSVAEIYVSHIVKDGSEELYGFRTLREKKLFELLITVNGVGPKSGYSLVKNLGAESIIEAVLIDNKAALKKAPGVGPKAAAQLILDLSEKIKKIKMYKDEQQLITNIPTIETTNLDNTYQDELPGVSSTSSELTNYNSLLDDAILACTELGFREDKVLPIAKKLLSNNKIIKAEQLVHLVLREV